jgi:hypothetical protein
VVRHRRFCPARVVFSGGADSAGRTIAPRDCDFGQTPLSRRARMPSLREDMVAMTAEGS